MTANPYQSPSLTVREIDADEGQPRKRGPLAMAILGLVAGALIGGTAGAASSASLGVALGMASAQYDYEVGGETGSIPETLIFLAVMGAFMGCFYGGISGGVLGLLLGIVAGCTTHRFRRTLTVSAATLSGLCGAAFEALGGSLFDSGGFLWISIGGGLGLLGGILGGALLGRGLGILAWGRVQKASHHTDTEPAPAP